MIREVSGSYIAKHRQKLSELIVTPQEGEGAQKESINHITTDVEEGKEAFYLP